MFLKPNILKRLGLAVAILIFTLPEVIAQEEAAPKDGKIDVVWRIGFWEILHQTFSNDEAHPFYQMTGTNRFRGGKGFYGTTFLDIGESQILPNISKKNEDGQSSEDRFLTNLFSKVPFLRGIPTFSLEYILPTDYFFGIGLSFAYTNIWLDDEIARAATTGADPSYATPLVRLTSHFYMFSTSIHPFGVPNPDDIDIFLGIGLSRIESTLRYGIRKNPDISEYAPITKTELSSSSGTFPYRRLGIASGGESFGFLLEFLLTDENEIIDNPFSSNTVIDSDVFDSTYNDRGGALPAKVGMSGGITRFSWTYSF